MNEKPVIFVVDDDPAILRLIASVLHHEGMVVQPYSNAADFLEHFDIEQRGCLLLDLQMPDLSGLELQQELQSRLIDLPILFLTATADVSTAVKAMKHGAVDLLQKPFAVPALIAAVHRALEKDARRSTETQRYKAILERQKRLTPREREVMALVVKGHSNKQMASQLGLSAKTVEIHRGRVMKKMEAESVADLVHQVIELSRYTREP